MTFITTLQRDRALTFLTVSCRLFFNTLRMPEGAGLKKIKKNIRSGPIGKSCRNIHAKIQMPTKVNLRNDAIT